MDKISIACVNCSDKYEEDIFYEEFEQQDDFEIYQCPECTNQIRMDSIQLEAIPFLNWFRKNDWKIYKKYIKQYFKEQGIECIG